MRRAGWTRVAGWALLAVLLASACEDERRSAGQVEQQQPQVRRPPPQVQAECNGECRRALPSVGTLRRLALQSLLYGERDEIVIINRRAETMSLDGWIASTGDAEVPLPPGISVPSDGLLYLHLGRSGTSTGTDVYLPELSLGPAGEFALFTGPEKSARTIALYNRWGAEPEGTGTSYISLAFEAEFWPSRGYVPVCEGYPGFVAVGDVGLPRGFRSMPETCFQSAANNPSGRPF